MRQTRWIVEFDSGRTYTFAIEQHARRLAELACDAEWGSEPKAMLYRAEMDQPDMPFDPVWADLITKAVYRAGRWQEEVAPS